MDGLIDESRLSAKLEATLKDEGDWFVPAAFVV
jgi:hypothetical protein